MRHFYYAAVVIMSGMTILYIYMADNIDFLYLIILPQNLVLYTRNGTRNYDLVVPLVSKLHNKIFYKYLELAF